MKMHSNAGSIALKSGLSGNREIYYRFQGATFGAIEFILNKIRRSFESKRLTGSGPFHYMLFYRIF